jgi:hypothetical protein
MRNKARKIRAAFDANTLKAICAEDNFDAYGQRYICEGKDRYFHYADNGSDILAVAHLDSVADNIPAQVIDTAAGPIVLSPALDDRLGAYVILDLLPKLGVNCDVLLTTGEESCNSTARDFATAELTDKQYNWTFSFDRTGTDVVMYDYGTQHLKQLLREVGADVGIGSYSDIADLDTLGCAGFNWGVGYRDYHGPRAHAWLNDTFMMVSQFLEFHQHHSAELFEYEHIIPTRGYWRKWSQDMDDAWDNSSDTPSTLILPEDCPNCRSELTYGYCEDCGSDWWNDRHLQAWNK